METEIAFRQEKPKYNNNDIVTVHSLSIKKHKGKFNYFYTIDAAEVGIKTLEVLAENGIDETIEIRYFKYKTTFTDFKAELQGLINEK